MVKPLSLDPGRHDPKSPYYESGHPPRGKRGRDRPEPEPPEDAAVKRNGGGDE